MEVPPGATRRADDISDGLKRGPRWPAETTTAAKKEVPLLHFNHLKAF